jgi:hypothetical protein
LWGSKGGFGFGQKVDLAFAWDGDVSGEDEPKGKAGEFVVCQPSDGRKQNLF